jgi:hypothetical protein
MLRLNLPRSLTLPAGERFAGALNPIYAGIRASRGLDTHRYAIILAIL